jgi:ribonuclease D
VRRTALVQLASADACVLAHVYALERLPPRLSALLEDPSVLKVGTGVISDLDKLAADFAVRFTRT